MKVKITIDNLTKKCYNIYVRLGNTLKPKNTKGVNYMLTKYKFTMEKTEVFERKTTVSYRITKKGMELLKKDKYFSEMLEDDFYGHNCGLPSEIYDYLFNLDNYHEYIKMTGYNAFDTEKSSETKNHMEKI